MNRPVRRLFVPGLLLLAPLVQDADALRAQTLPGGGFTLDPNVPRRIEPMLHGPDGRMWMGDDTGLWVYDGYDSRRFVPAAGSETPPAGAVRSLFLDDQGRLWVGQWRALVVIDALTEVVLKVYRHDPDDPSSLLDGDVAAVFQDRAGRIWAGSVRWSNPDGGGLSLLDPDEEGFRRFQHDPSDPTSLTDNRIRSIAQDSRGNLWIGTWAGLNRMDPDAGEFVRYTHDPAFPSSLAYDDVKALHAGDGGRMWVATIGGGLDRYLPSIDGFEHIPTPGSGMLTDVVEDDDGRLWLGTFDGGLLSLDPGASAPEAVDLRPAAANDVRVSGLSVSRDGVLWVAVFTSDVGGGALLRLDLEGSAIAVRPIANALAVHEASTGEVWLGGEREIHRWNPASDSVRRFECPGLGAPDEDAWSSGIETSADGTVWVGFWDEDLGLCRRRAGEDAFEAVSAGDPRLRLVSDLVASGDEVWLAADGYLLALDPETLAYETLLPTAEEWASEGSRVRTLALDAGGDLWFVTTDGTIGRRRAATGEIERFGRILTVPTTRDRWLVTDIWPSRGPRLWIATGGYGLCDFDTGAGRCSRIWTRDEGLRDDYLTSVVEDRRGHVWLTSKLGLTELDPAAGTLRHVPRPARLEEAEFRPGAATLGLDGDVYLGTGLGIVSLDPADALGNTRPPDVLITRVEAVGGGDIGPGTRDSGAARGPVELPSELDDLVFEYVGLHYSNPDANTYSYRLDGQDEDWRNVGSERRARYTNLAPGSYEFRVRAASVSGVWSDEASFAFRVLTPWWRRPWALGLWAFLAIGALAAARIVELRQRRMSLALEREQRSAARLRELSETRSRLFASLSHEYRTPLALILGQIESARAAAGGGDAKLEMAERQTRDLQRLTDELLDLSRFEAGALTLDRRPGDLVPVVRRAVADFASAAEAAGVSLRVEAGDAPVRARFDPDRMANIVNNLVSNALKFTPRGGAVTVSVERRAADDGSAAILCVEDSGAGIEPEALPHVFDRFFRAAPGSDSAPVGSGIGLALVRELVELHGGTIDVESEVGRGTRFEVRFPLEVEAPAAPAEPAPAGERPAGGAGAEDADRAESDLPIILVIEDHEDTRTFLRQELSGAYRVEEAVDGRTGIDRAVDLVPDLVITDVMMPERDGYEVARRIRADERTSHVPIIMLTGRASEDSKVAGLESGVDEYLTKPFSTRVLRTRVRNLLDIRRMLRERYAGDVWLRPRDVSTGTPLDQRFLERVADIIEQRMSDNEFSVEELAQAVSMSRSQLHRKLKALIGQPPSTLVRTMRLQRAADLVREGDRPLGQIALDTGFADQAHFSRSFRKQFGCPPSEYRAQPPS